MDRVHIIPSSQRRLAALAAQADPRPVLIHGAAGTGKEGIGRWIHANSPRAGTPFIQASRQRALIEQLLEAQGGSILIPEIGEWPLGDQRILLDVIQSRTIPQPGAPEMRRVCNVRVLATASQTLDRRAQGGLFNVELLERLSAFRIEMPSLRDRSDEFEDIVTTIVAEITHELHKDYLRSLSPEAWQALRAYEWPGNLRELRNVLRMAVTSAQGDEITLNDLPEFGHHQADLRTTRDQFEKLYLKELLKIFDSNIDRACEVTRLNKDVLLAKLRKHGLELSASP